MTDWHSGSKFRRKKPARYQRNAETNGNFDHVGEKKPPIEDAGKAQSRSGERVSGAPSQLLE